MDRPWQKKAHAFGTAPHGQRNMQDRAPSHNNLMTSSLFNQLLRSTSAKKFEQNEILSHHPVLQATREPQEELADSLKYMKGLRKQLKQNISNFMKTTEASLEEVPANRQELGSFLARSNKETLLCNLADFTSFYTEEAKKNASSNLLILNQMKTVISDLERKCYSEPKVQEISKVRSKERLGSNFQEQGRQSELRASVVKRDKSLLQRMNQKYLQLVSTQNRFSSDVSQRIDDATKRLNSLLELVGEVRSVAQPKQVEITPRVCYNCTLHETELGTLALQLEEKQKIEIQLKTEIEFDKKKLERLQKELKLAATKLGQLETNQTQGISSQLELLQGKHKKLKEDFNAALLKCAKLEVDGNQAKKELEVKLSYLLDQNLKLQLKLDEKDDKEYALNRPVVQIDKEIQADQISKKSLSVQTVDHDKIERQKHAQSYSTQYTSPRISHANIEELIIANKNVENTLRAEIEQIKAQLKTSVRQSSSEQSKKEVAALELQKVQEENIKLKEMISDLQKEASSVGGNLKTTLKQNDQFLESVRLIMGRIGLPVTISSLPEASTNLQDLASRYSTMKNDLKSLELTLKEIENAVPAMNEILPTIHDFPLEAASHLGAEQPVAGAEAILEGRCKQVAARVRQYVVGSVPLESCISLRLQGVKADRKCQALSSALERTHTQVEVADSRIEELKTQLADLSSKLERKSKQEETIKAEMTKALNLFTENCRFEIESRNTTIYLLETRIEDLVNILESVTNKLIKKKEILLFLSSPPKPTSASIHERYVKEFCDRVANLILGTNSEIEDYELDDLFKFIEAKLVEANISTFR